jgi:hypothetical protein
MMSVNQAYRISFHTYDSHQYACMDLDRYLCSSVYSGFLSVVLKSCNNVRLLVTHAPPVPSSWLTYISKFRRVICLCESLTNLTSQRYWRRYVSELVCVYWCLIVHGVQGPDLRARICGIGSYGALK